MCIEICYFFKLIVNKIKNISFKFLLFVLLCVKVFIKDWFFRMICMIKSLIQLGIFKFYYIMYFFLYEKLIIEYLMSIGRMYLIIVTKSLWCCQCVWNTRYLVISLWLWNTKCEISHRPCVINSRNETVDIWYMVNIIWYNYRWILKWSWYIFLKKFYEWNMQLYIQCID